MTFTINDYSVVVVRCCLLVETQMSWKHFIWDQSITVEVDKIFLVGSHGFQGELSGDQSLPTKYILQSIMGDQLKIIVTQPRSSDLSSPGHK